MKATNFLYSQRETRISSLGILKIQPDSPRALALATLSMQLAVFDAFLLMNQALHKA